MVVSDHQTRVGCEGEMVIVLFDVRSDTDVKSVIQLAVQVVIQVMVYSSRHLMDQSPLA